MDYRSQDLPEIFHLIEYQHRLEMSELRIQPGDKSRRLEPEVLEHVWNFESPRGAEMPFWAKRGDHALNHVIEPASMIGASCQVWKV